MSKKNIIIFSIVIILLIIISTLLILKYNEEEIDLYDDLKLDGYNKLMIVAHPDDDMLWGGSRLIEDNYLVVCITCGVDKTRVKEFKRVMKETNDQYLMLGYPDKTNGKRDDWVSSKESMLKDFEKILSLKDWELIVTHNPFGEYGHNHHKMTNEFVTSKVSDKDKLYYFGVYYSKANIGPNIDKMGTIKEDTLKKKIEILKLYKSQSFIMTSFDHMIEHEDWVSYKDWQEGAR